MKIKKIIEPEIDIKYLYVYVPIYYENEDIPFDFPGRIKNNDDFDLLTLLIDIDTGKIINWDNEFGQKHGGWHLEMKVCDGGTYYLINENCHIISKIEDYVPNNLGIGSDDYLEMSIDKDGYILGFKNKRN